MGGQSAPRYSGIAAVLRRRIETGELAPGDRVPSTREITRRWGVAMATATKALTELRREGLVRAVPGVGTVVAPRDRPARPARPAAPPHRGRPSGASSDPAALTLGRIVAAAVTVADAEGLAAVSMRRVAAELGAATMSLYRHVADKDDLLTRMMDRVVAERPLPSDRPESWREAVELAVRQFWDLFRRHPWLAAALSVTRPQMITTALPYSEWVLATLHEQGLDPRTAFTAHLMLLNHARGTAIHLETEREAEADSGLDSEEWMDTQEPALMAILAGGGFPELSRLTTTGFELDLDALFEFGLRRLLDGLGVLLGETPQPS
ncbi:TetR/AcrR family transcriptional regulator C-terminal domain-containing protein [Streptomyces diastaticus]|uniref:TetR/AcrR family transcriptional regulator C-terminal domain-containing protein n=1 Tax=Streptomyces diastaticus TaxID=1956 RepID=UPI0013C0917D|nr:GntR family transcriptional regulator [Streptomyces sp. SID7982]